MCRLEYVECGLVKQFTYKNTYAPSPKILVGDVDCDYLLRCVSAGRLADAQHVVRNILRLRPGVTRSVLARLLYENNFPHALVLLFGNVPRKKPAAYTTMFGPVFHGPWLIYDDTPANLDRAHTRITACREAPPNYRVLMADYGFLTTFKSTTHERNIEWEKFLQDQNRLAHTGLGKGRGHARILHSLLGGVRARLNEKLSRLRDVATEINFFARMKHTKMKVRVAAIKELIAKAENDSGGLYTRRIAGKLKLFERAKPGKYPRLIGDYSTPGSLLGGFLCDILKSCYGHYSINSGGYFEFIKTSDPEKLDEMGRKLRQGTEDLFYYHSDDSLMRLNGKYFEMDISSCDTSNTPGVFQNLTRLFSDFPQFHDVIERTVRQCQNRVTVTHPYDKKAKIHLFPKNPVEYSGTTLTTSLNNLASLSIMMSIHKRRASTAAEITTAAIAVGYVVTVAERSALEECQFLKHSWWTNPSGEVRSFLNLGPILRSFGSCRRDLPGRGDLQRRAMAWNAACITAYMHTGENRLLRAIRQQYTSRDKVTLPDEIVKHCHTQRRDVIPDEAYIKRYNIPECEWRNLCNLVSCTQFGVIRCKAVEAIYATDYGLDSRPPIPPP